MFGLNADMARFRLKFKSFIDQYELRELQFHSLLRTKELEIQYQMARLEQQRKQQEAESSKSHQLTRQVSTFSQTETELRTQLNIYVEKFKQVSLPSIPLCSVASWLILTRCRLRKLSTTPTICS